jgi:hypothetical protein
MANDYGDKQEPGIVTDLTSAAAVPTQGEAPTDMGMVGQANLGGGASQGTADPNTVYQVTRATKAREWFGDEADSLLTQALIDALNEGAYPVYAVAPASNGVTGEDISQVSSTTVSLAEDALREDAATVTVTLDGTDLVVNLVYDDVSTYSPADGECFVNPVYGELKLPNVPGDADDTNDTVDYTHFDYEAGIDTLAVDAGGIVDFVTPLNEAQSVVDYANTEAGNMEREYDLALLLGGADIYIGDTLNYTQEYDDSRTQTVYPTRFADGSSALAAYAGRRATMGLDQTPINKRLSTNKRLMYSLTRTQRGNLIEKNVVPLADEARGARIVDDPTTVSDSNTDEMNLKYGFNRLVMDYITETVRLNERPYIGRLNRPEVRRMFANVIRSELDALRQSGVVLSYSVNVAKVDATTASLEVSVDLAEPLRFIENTVTVGSAA